MSNTGARFFHPDYGLKALDVAAAVRDVGPLLTDAHGRFWTYDGGVWGDGEREVARRIVRALGQRYRGQHQNAVSAVLRAELPEMDLRPVGSYLNVRNGMVQWGADPDPVLLDHHPEYMSTVQLPVDWYTEASCQEFDAFLDQSVPPDDRQRVWEVLGYLMMSGNPLQRMFMLIGGGGNGKGVLLHVIKHLLGRANTSAVPLQEFAENQFATAELFGKLANICGDIDATWIENTGRIKEMAGEDEMKGERKFGQPFYFTFWGKAIFSANGIPGAADSSRGWLRRWEVINFPYEPVKPDRTLKDRLVTPESLSGIAVRAVGALRGLMERGTFSHGDSANAAHRDFAQRSNKVLQWIEEECTADPESWHVRTELLTIFRRWDAEQNPSGKAIGSQTFYERLRQVHGMREVTRRGKRGFAGLQLHHSAPHDPDSWLANPLLPAETL